MDRSRQGRARMNRDISAAVHRRRYSTNIDRTSVDLAAAVNCHREIRLRAKTAPNGDCAATRNGKIRPPRGLKLDAQVIQLGTPLVARVDPQLAVALDAHSGERLLPS